MSLPIRTFLSGRSGAQLVVLAVVACLLLGAGCAERGGGQPKLPEVIVVQGGPAEWADAMKRGFVDGLKASGLEPGNKVQLVEQSAAGDAQTLTAIAQGARASGPNLVFTLGTQASQAVFSAVKNTPILYGAVTDPVKAGFYDKSLGKPLGDITGTQDIWPYEAQFDLIQRLLPRIKKLGVPSNPSEINTQVSVAHIRRIAEAGGIEIVEKPVATQLEVTPATAALLDASIDAVFIPADNTLQTAASAIIAACNARKVPVFTGISGIVENGALATVGTNYYELGRVNGQMAARILRGERARDIPVSTARRGDVYINLKAAGLLGVKVPAEIVAQAFKVYK